jgi:hypothetical protein
MINITAQEFARKLWEIDPMGTCCNVNEGMEDEYKQIAADTIEWSKKMSAEDALKLVIVSYFDLYLYEYHKEELALCLS